MFINGFINNVFLVLLVTIFLIANMQIAKTIVWKVCWFSLIFYQHMAKRIGVDDAFFSYFSFKHQSSMLYALLSVKFRLVDENYLMALSLFTNSNHAFKKIKQKVMIRFCCKKRVFMYDTILESKTWALARDDRGLLLS